MSTPFSQTSQDVSISLDPSNSQGLTPAINNNGTVNINLSLNLPSNFFSQNEINPVSSQFYSHQNGSDSSVIRSDFSTIEYMHSHNISRSDPPQPQNSISINIKMGNNPPINIDLLNNNLSSHLFSSPSSNIPDPDNVINYDQIALSPNQEPVTNLSESREFTSDFMMTANSLQTSIPRDDQEIPVAVPCSRQSALMNSSFYGRQAYVPRQGIQRRNHFISQRNCNVSLIRTSATGYFPLENHNDFSTSESSTMNPMNGHPQPQPISEAEPLRQQSFQGPPGFSPLLAHSGIQSQTEDGNLRSNFHDYLQRRGYRQSTTGCGSEPQMNRNRNMRGGPYQCPKCPITFSCVHRYAAHANSHYKHESSDEKKKRRGSKLKKRDLHIAQTSAGITVMPRPRPIQDPLFVASTSTSTSTSSTPTPTPTPYVNVRIKEEIETD